MKKELYERLIAWMADYEGTSRLQEAMPAGEIPVYLMNCAYDIMYDIHCDEMSKKWTEEDQLQNDGNEYWN